MSIVEADMHTRSECFVEGTDPVRCQEEDAAIVFEDSEEYCKESDFAVLKKQQVERKRT